MTIIKDTLKNGENFVYPQTSTDQVVKANGERLEVDGIIDADTLGGTISKNGGRFNGNIYAPNIPNCVAHCLVFYNETDNYRIEDNYNISSITNDGLDTYTVTFINPLPSNKYYVYISAEVGGRGTEIIGIYRKTKNAFVFDTTSYDGQPQNISEASIIVFMFN